MLSLWLESVSVKVVVFPVVFELCVCGIPIAGNLCNK